MQVIRNFFASHNFTKSEIVISVSVAIPVLTWLVYYRKKRVVNRELSLTPNLNIVAANPSEYDGLSSWLSASGESWFQTNIMAGLHNLIIHKTMKELQTYFSAQPSNDTKTMLNNLKVIDVGTSVGGMAFQLSKLSNISSVTGVDLDTNFIDHALQRLENETTEDNRKIQFMTGDGQKLSQFESNQFDIGFCILVFHDLPETVPINMIVEMSRICKYVCVVDWCGGDKFPLNYSGLRNGMIEFGIGPSHFGGFRHWLALGGLDSHIEALMKFYNNGIIDTRPKSKKPIELDSGTMSMYVLDTSKVTPFKSKL